MENRTVETAKRLVSVIICAYNRKEMLDLCLQSVLSQDYANVQIVVIDDNSNDGTSEFIKAKYPSVHLITNATNKGPAYAKNQGIIASRGDLLLFIDSDVELIDKSSIAKMASLLVLDKTIGEIGGEIQDYSDPKNYSIIGANIGDDGWPVLVSLSNSEKDKPKECDYVPTSNCMLRKEIIHQVGGFDPYFFYPAEDTALGFEIKKAGFRNVISADAGAWHKLSQQSRIHSYYMAKRATMRFLLKEYGILRFLSIELKRYFSPLKRQQKLREIDQKAETEAFDNSLNNKFAYFFALLKAYLWNLFYLPQTISARGKNFLTSKEMKRYKKPLL
ncbi:TPA: glycosyltransferase [Candidatus Poribacteria bacterium]|nr:glycosyltransferase [Candidatus Poribacteria bacterium]